MARSNLSHGNCLGILWTLQCFTMNVHQIKQTCKEHPIKSIDKHHNFCSMPNRCQNRLRNKLFNKIFLLSRSDCNADEHKMNVDLWFFSSRFDFYIISSESIFSNFRKLKNFNIASRETKRVGKNVNGSDTLEDLRKPCLV